MGKYIPPTPAEIHATGIGFLDAHKADKETFEEALSDAEKDFNDVRHEKHYYRAGYGIRNQWKTSVTALSGLLTGLIILLQQVTTII